MTSILQPYSSSALRLLVACILLFHGEAIASPEDRDCPVQDQAVHSYQTELLDLGFKVASKLPLNPHIKNRARLQGTVINACLELDQPERALSYTGSIDNWRKGLAYAELALYCVEQAAEKKLSSTVKSYLDTAEKVAEEYIQREDSQAWRSDRIRATVAQVYLLLDLPEEVARVTEYLEEDEAGKIDVMKSKIDELDDEAFDARVKGLDTQITNGSLDQAVAAMESLALLFDRFYTDEERRSIAEDTIRASLKKVPLSVAMGMVMKLAEFALDHDDTNKALALAKESKELMGLSTWLPQYKIPLMARIAKLLHSAGNMEHARSTVQEALDLFDTQREKIVDIFRAEALIPLAETYHSMDDLSASMTVYAMAVEEGVMNPNSRPRAEDLTAVCCSMALHGVEPDTDLWARMIQIYEELGQPW